MTAVIIGVDFDNTIVCYDTVFHEAAVSRGLIPQEVPTDKSSVRNYLREAGREDDWTELQGYVYGPGMSIAKPFPGVFDFFEKVSATDIPISVISHRTKKPYLGPEYDLHASARDWLKTNKFPARSAFFEETKLDKIKRIADTGCTHFIDDLPEFLREESFPADVTKILFDPNDLYEDSDDLVRVTGWAQISDMMLDEVR